MHADELKPTGTVTISTDEYNLLRDFKVEMELKGHVVLIGEYYSRASVVYKCDNALAIMMDRAKAESLDREERLLKVANEIRQWRKLPLYKKLFNVPKVSQYL